MSSASRFMNKFIIGLVLLTAATTGALANQRGPVQASFDGSERVAAAAVDSEVSAREDGSFDGARVVPADRFGRYSYIIRFEEPSLARYEGGIEGLAATSPRVTGERLHTASDAKAAYTSFLASRHENYVAQISQFARRSVEVERQFLNALNGVVVRLNREEADRVAGLPFVAGIEVNRFDEILLDEGPALIGAPSFWDGDIIGDGNRGEGVVIGIIDSGFNHDHPSFAEVAEDGYVHVNPNGDGVFLGVCADPNADDYEDLCNNKLIGAYNLAEGSVTAEDTAASGHGTHVGSTAGGNPLAGVVYPFNYLDLTVDLTGVAPRANLINYKVCEPLCSSAARIAAIDNAINDGVSVLNHSIGNGEPPWASSVSLAFLDANAAGIFVAASAGNSGPGPSTVASTGPWNAAVAASTHQRRLAFELDVTGGDQDIPVSSTSGPAITGPLVGDLAYAGDVGDGSNFEGCVAFDANAFDGVGALIRRGGCTFATKVNNAADAGATFVFIANNAGGLFGAGGLEGTTIPSIAVGQSTGDDLIVAIGGGTVGVSVEAIIDVDPANADIMAGFSSRGPAGYNHIAPTVTAPGVQILAASTDVNGNFNVLGGTSMSSPHVAGSAALLMAENPDWTPTEVRSALALSANPNTLKEDGVTPSDPFDHGSGRIQVADAGSVGFVMDESIANFEAANPAEGGEPADLNMPSIQDSSCVENCSFQRTIRSVVDQPIDYVVTSDTPAGVTITVTPDAFTLNPGSTATLDIDIDVTGAPFEEWLFAEIQIEQAPTVVGVPTMISEDFESGTFPPVGWQNVNLGGDCDWIPNDQATDFFGDPRPNHAGGNGLSAAADSDFCGDETTMDAALVSPEFNVTADTELSFVMSFRALGTSFFNIEVSTDGTNWDVLDNFTESLDPQGPGAFQTYDLSAYDGESAQVRFRYVSPGWNWWAQVDNVMVAEASDPLEVADTQMPVAVISLAPKPTIAVSVEGLVATQQRDEVTAQDFSISNEGQLPLEWTLNELGPQGGLSTTVDGVIWDNPQLSSSGRINNFSIPDGTGIYQADAFAILAPSGVETIASAGFELGNPGITDFVWSVFEDAGGVPAGDPETNPEDAIWSFQAAVDAAGVTYDGGDLTLDVAAAGAPALDLAPGVYWILIYPTVQTYSLGPNNLYAWFHGESVGTGRQIGPGGLSGFPADWVGAPEGRAFTLTGTIDCTSQFNPWTNVSPTSGMLDPGTSEQVNVEFYATGLQEGTYQSGLCILSNDDDQPATLLPVSLNVVNLPAGSASIDSHDFSVEYGNTDNVEMVIRNDGLGDLEFSVRGAGNAPAGSGLIYDQTASQTNFGTIAFYDLDGPETWAVQAADDFTVPADRSWIIDRVVGNGFYLPGGSPTVDPTQDVRVYFYEDDAGAPGDEIAAFDDLVPTTDENGVLTIDLPETVALAGGTYWISVQPEMDFVTDGRWLWFSNTDQVGSPFHWRNPGNGYGTGCVDWDTAINCGTSTNPDVSFQLFGTSEDVCDAVDAVPWLSVDPESGTVAAEGGEQPVSLIVDGSEALPGSYEATVCFDTNDGANPVLVVNVGMEVTGEAPDSIFQDRFETDE